MDNDGYLALDGIVHLKQVEAIKTRLEELLAVAEQDHTGSSLWMDCPMRRSSTPRGCTHAYLGRYGTSWAISTVSRALCHVGSGRDTANSPCT